MLTLLAPDGKVNVASWISQLSDEIHYNVSGFDKAEWIAIQWGENEENDWFLIAGQRGDTSAADGYSIDANGNVDFSRAKAIATAPEPATFAVLGLGLAGLAALRRRKK